MNAFSTALPAATAEVSGLTLGYGKGPAVLEGLHWQLLPGQVVGLLGRNGAGKTTLLEALLGLREPQAGTVRLFGSDAGGLDDAGRARIGYVPQRSDLFEGFTPMQMLDYFKSFYPRWNTAKVDGLLARWEIQRHQRIGQLSGGQQQRLAIIRALAHDPELLVLDEPVSGLDPAARRDFLSELVEQVIERGTTVVFSTHILSDLERVAFHLAFLRGGRIALQAPLDDLLDQVRLLRGSQAELNALLQRLGAESLSRQPLAAGHDRVLARLPAGAPWPHDVAAETVTLEDLYMELT
jgi:ABC-2 type transport system ATP-binding protein